MNWGKGVTVVIVLFMLYILSFVYRAFQNDTELVTADYYEQEANFENDRESKNNYTSLNSDVVVVKEENGICFYFPEDIQDASNGSISFYRPDAKSMDRSFSLSLDTDQVQCLSYDNFYEGYYEITVEWSNNAKAFIFEDNIMF